MSSVLERELSPQVILSAESSRLFTALPGLINGVMSLRVIFHVLRLRVMK